MQIRDLLDHGPVLSIRIFVNNIGKVVTDHGMMGGDNRHIQVINFLKLGGLGVGCAGHAGQLVVHAEIILKGDGGHGLILALDLHPLLGLQCLMQPVAVTPAGHGPAGKFVNNDHLAVLNQIIHIPLKKEMGLQGLI